MAISDMAAKGQAKLARKVSQMAANYNAAKGRAAANYGARGFGPRTTSAYQSGINAATYRAPDPGLWAQRWAARMAE